MDVEDGPTRYDRGGAAAVARGSPAVTRLASRDRAAALTGFGLPPGRDTELLAEAGGLLMGRFLLTPGDGRPTLEQRLAAVGLADPGRRRTGRRPAGAPALGCGPDPETATRQRVP